MNLCIHIYAWVSPVEDGCRDCSQLTKKEFVCPLRSKLWLILTAIGKSFCVNLRRWMKHGSTTILWNHVKGQNSGTYGRIDKLSNKTTNLFYNNRLAQFSS